jgi:hypothetical protein
MGIATTLKFDSSLPLLDAVDFMNTAYEQARALFLLYERVVDTPQKLVIAEECCLALKLNLEVEKNILCPALMRAVCNKVALSAAMTSQSVLYYLIEEVAQLDKAGAVFDIKLKLLGSQFKDHINVMRTRVFRHLHDCQDLNLYHLRTEMEAFKGRLMANLA